MSEHDTQAAFFQLAGYKSFYVTDADLASLAEVMAAWNKRGGDDKSA